MPKKIYGVEQVVSEAETDRSGDVAGKAGCHGMPGTGGHRSN